ncbi:hypothetical protein [Rhizobium sp. RCAM05973]|uniref:hypothetical protein n=1 Tax=Rhizobium sp. RCAM05973 TaxID=2994066 RepID=UPI0022EBD9EE|nr:hypothetical protein [Rhizobium sp. RCAM05973]
MPADIFLNGCAQSSDRGAAKGWYDVIHIPVQILSNAVEFERYIEDCVLALRQQNGVGKQYKLTANIVVYEPVQAATIARVKALSNDHFVANVISIDRNCGYGEKQNLVWREYTKKLVEPFDAFITMNPDMILMPDVLDKLYSTFINSAGRANIVEARQFPIENPPRAFDRETLEVNWCSGACILISAAFLSARTGSTRRSTFIARMSILAGEPGWTGVCLYRYDAVVAHMTQGIFEARYNSHSVATHEFNMALSHLILTWKYFSANKAVFESKMKLFWDNQWIARHTKEAALAQLEAVKPKIERFVKTHPRIDILDFGLYSGMRPNLI